MLKVVPFSSPIPSRKVALAWRASFDRPIAVDTLAQAIRAIKMPCLKMRDSLRQVSDQRARGVGRAGRAPPCSAGGRRRWRASRRT